MKYAFIGSGEHGEGHHRRACAHGHAGGGHPRDNPNNPKSCAEVQAMYGAVPAPAEAVAEADTVVVAVKPQAFPAAAPVYAPFVKPARWS